MANTPAPGGNLSVFTMPKINKMPVLKPVASRNTSGAASKPVTSARLGTGSKPPKLPKAAPSPPLSALAGKKP